MIAARIASRVFEAPLMIDGSKAATILAALGSRLSEGGLTVEGGFEPVAHVAFENGRPSMGKVGDRLGRAYDRAGVAPFDLVDGVAVIAIEGTLVHKGAFVGSSSGETSYQGLQVQVRRAMKADYVKAVVFEIDSFGGEVAGAFETAAMIRELSAVKPTIAILTDFALSAGYLMASAARQIVMPEFGRAGSIGVIRLHVDLSQNLAMQGKKVTILSAGKHKAAGSSLEALPEALANSMRAELETGRQRFAEAVALGRGERFSKQQALDTEAAHFRAEEAVSLGLADAIGDGSQAFEEFVKAVNA